MMRMIARLNAVALNNAARPKMMLATPNATAVAEGPQQERGAQQYSAQW